MSQSVYVWQRQADTSLRTALREHASAFSHVNRLTAEVTWTPDGPRVARADLPAAELRPLTSLGLTLRVGALPGETIGTPDDSRPQFLQKLSVDLVDKARAAGLTVNEFQVDFDAAESQLFGYAVWLHGLRAALPGDIRLTFTALPSWLNNDKGFAALLGPVDEYVLQVHSLERANAENGDFRLYRMDEARRAVERAARFGKPFLVSLPTYGYQLFFNQEDRRWRLASALPSSSLPPGIELHTVLSSPADMLALLNGWEEDRPAAMKGVIWFRLPVGDDDLNWPWSALAEVMHGRNPSSELKLEIARDRAPLIELRLRNDGTDTFAGPVHLRVGGTRGLIASDTLASFHPDDDGGISSSFFRLPPGRSITAGWYRFTTFPSDFYATLKTP